MFKKKIDKIVNEKMESLNKNLKSYIDAQLKIFMETLKDNIQEVLKTLLEDEKFLNKMGEKLEEAEASRLAKNTELKIEELSKKEQSMFKSKTPWVDVESMGEEDGNIKLRLAWNPAFIEYLKKNGFNAENEEELVQQYLGRLNLDILLEEYD